MFPGENVWEIAPLTPFVFSAVWTDRNVTLHIFISNLFHYYFWFNYSCLWYFYYYCYLYYYYCSITTTPTTVSNAVSCCATTTDSQIWRISILHIVYMFMFSLSLSSFLAVYATFISSDPHWELYHCCILHLAPSVANPGCENQTLFIVESYCA